MAKKDDFDFGNDGSPFAADNGGSFGDGTTDNGPFGEDPIEIENDPNEIVVTIADPAPIVILFGAKTSGKTMTLVRLTRYLQLNGYDVSPDTIFRSGKSENYKKLCKSFMANVNSDNAADGTNILNFMLLKVRKKHGGPMVCQILEAPGEHYFDPVNDFPFPTYINKICNDRQHAKVWVFIVEVDWNNEEIRRAYAKKVAQMRNKISANDKIILMCHKADKQIDSLYNRGLPNKIEYYRTIKSQYPEIFDSNRNTIPIKSWFTPYDMDFVVFSAGTFNQTNSGNQIYTESDRIFPDILWKTILKKVRGGWF